LGHLSERERRRDRRVELRGRHRVEPVEARGRRRSTRPGVRPPTGTVSHRRGPVHLQIHGERVRLLGTEHASKRRSTSVKRRSTSPPGPAYDEERRGPDLPLHGRPGAAPEGQKTEHDRLKAEVICPWVFNRSNRKVKGKRITTFVKAFRAAYTKAGCPGRIPHDLRRTAVRNLVRAGVPERVAMQMTGHKTRSVFERYNIVSECDLVDAAKKLNAMQPVPPTSRPRRAQSGTVSSDRGSRLKVSL